MPPRHRSAWTRHASRSAAIQERFRRSVQPHFNSGDPSATIDGLLQFAEAGFSELVVYVGPTDPVRDAETVAEKVLPAIRGAVARPARTQGLP